MPLPYGLPQRGGHLHAWLVAANHARGHERHTSGRRIGSGGEPSGTEPGPDGVLGKAWRRRRGARGAADGIVGAFPRLRRGRVGVEPEVVGDEDVAVTSEYARLP